MNLFLFFAVIFFLFKSSISLSISLSLSLSLSLFFFSLPSFSSFLSHLFISSYKPLSLLRYTHWLMLFLSPSLFFPLLSLSLTHTHSLSLSLFPTLCKVCNGTFVRSVTSITSNFLYFIVLYFYIWETVILKSKSFQVEFIAT